jgi:microcystin-dependent protein
MPKLNFEAPNTNISNYSITDNLSLLQDGFFNMAKDIVKRPGLKPFFDLATINAIYDTTVDGIFWFNDIDSLIVCVNGAVIKITDSLGTYSILGTSLLTVGSPVTFAICSDASNGNTPTLFMANGADIVYTTGTTAAKLSGTNIPTKVSHVASINSYLITNDLDNPTLWKHSDVTTPKTWANNFSYSAQSKTDTIYGLFETKGRLWVFGSSSLEAFYDSGYSIPFQRIDGAVIEPGCVNAQAFCKMGSDVFLLNTNREIVVIQGGTYTAQVLSDNYAERIKGLTSVNDVRTDYIISSSGRKFILFNFIDENLTLVYDPIMKCFYEWGLFSSISGTYGLYLGVNAAFVPTWNKCVICSRIDGNLFEVSDSYALDNLAPVRLEVETGTYNFGDILQYKQLSRIFLHVTRGNALTGSSSSSVATLEIKQDFAQAWTNPSGDIDLGTSGSTSLLDACAQGGYFRTIKLRIMHSDACIFALCGVYLEFIGGI